ncbi:MAG: PfkB family carbohydrate kinase, partial [Minisyncoccia bacterium]
MHDFIAIGDTVIDAFIKLKEASISGTPDTSDYKICLPFADKVPYESVTIIPAVGNAANAAVSASRLGLKTAIVTNIGQDHNGELCLEAFKKDNVDTSFVKLNPEAKTNYHYVLWYGPERTILIKHETYPYSLPEIDTPKWLYFSSVSENSFPFHNVVADFLDSHPETKLALQPGKNEIKLGKEKLERLYKRANIFFCNVEEAGKILGIETLGINELIKRMFELGPKMVVITDGPKGAYAYDGSDLWFAPVYPDQKPAYERTGAGDAFASTVASAIALGNDLPTALMWGATNSMSVVQKIGAQEGLLTKEA